MKYAKTIDQALYDSIGQYKLLTPKEERAVCIRAGQDMADYQDKRKAWQKAGSPPEEEPSLEVSALNELVLRNLRLIVSYLTERTFQGVELEDLFQEAAMGLRKAGEKFQPRRGLRFGTYAMYWVKQFVFRYMQDKSRMVRVPQSPYKQIAKLRRLRLDKASADFSGPTHQEAMRILNCDEKEYELILLLERQSTISLDATNTLDEDVTVAELIPDYRDDTPDRMEDICREEDMQYLNTLLTTLPPRYREILELRYGINGRGKLTLKAIAERLDLSRERIRQIENKAMKLLRRTVNQAEQRRSELQGSY